MRPGETYSIEEHDQACPRCVAALNLKTAHDTPAKAIFRYPWQQLVSDAFQEARPEWVPWKVNAAQRAISARLRDKTPTTLDEKIAIREALQTLQALFPEPKKESGHENESGGNKATA